MFKKILSWPVILIGVSFGLILVVILSRDTLADRSPDQVATACGDQIDLSVVGCGPGAYKVANAKLCSGCDSGLSCVIPVDFHVPTGQQRTITYPNNTVTEFEMEVYKCDGKTPPTPSTPSTTWINENSAPSTCTCS